MKIVCRPLLSTLESRVEFCLLVIKAITFWCTSSRQFVSVTNSSIAIQEKDLVRHGSETSIWLNVIKPRFDDTIKNYADVSRTKEVRCKVYWYCKCKVSVALSYIAHNPSSRWLLSFQYGALFQGSGLEVWSFPRGAPRKQHWSEEGIMFSPEMSHLKKCLYVLASFSLQLHVFTNLEGSRAQ